MRNLTILAISLLVFRCSSAEPQIDAPSDVLEPLEASVSTETPIETPVSPAAEKLQKRLATLGYEGVGMELETVEVLEFLLAVFNDPTAANRKIQTVYTGAANSYDASSQSLTVWADKDPKSILAFIKKKVPTRKKAARSSR